MVHVQLRRSRNVSVQLDASHEVLSRQRQHISDLTLCSSNKWTSQLGDLMFLEAAINVVEALRLIASSCRQILERFKLPVSPSSELLIAHRSNLTDLTSANFGIHACAKLRDNERDAESLRIAVSSSDSSVVPKLTLNRHVFSGLARFFTHRIVDHGQVAAVRMFVEDVGI